MGVKSVLNHHLSKLGWEWKINKDIAIQILK